MEIFSNLKWLLGTTKVRHFLVFLFLVSLFSYFFSLQFSKEVEETEASPVFSGFLVLEVLLFSLVLVALIRFFGARAVFLIMEFFLCFFTLDLLLSIFGVSFIFSNFILSLVYLFFRKKLRNLLLFLSISVFSGFFSSSFSLTFILFFSIFLAFYDILAVFFLKHMVFLAKSAIQSDAPVFMIFSDNSRKIEDISNDAQRKLSNNAFSNSVNVHSEMGWKNKDFFVIGNGDFVIPAMIFSKLLVGGHFLWAGLSFLLSFFGILLTLVQSSGRPMPALPLQVFLNAFFLSLAGIFGLI